MPNTDDRDIAELLDRDVSRRDVLRTGALALGSMPLAAAVLEACGGAATRTSSGGSSTTITIGVPVPLTGAWVVNGQNTLRGVQLAADDINKAGGIKAMNGAQLKVAQADTSSDNPAQAADVTRQLVSQGATALVGSYLSSLTLTSSTAAEQAHVPMITNSFVDQLTTRGYKYLFELPPISSVFGEKTVTYTLEMGKDVNVSVSNAAVVSSDDAAFRAQGQQVITTAKSSGLNVVASEFYSPGINDMTPIVSKVRAAKPDIIFIGGPLDPIILFVRTLRSLNDKTAVVGVGGGGILDPGFPQALGPASDGVLATSAWNDDLKQPGVADVAKRYRSRWKEPFMSQESGEAYVGTWVIAAALEAAKANDATKIRNAIADINLSGNNKIAQLWTGGTIGFDPNGRPKNAYPLMIEYKDRLPHTVWPKQDQVMKPFLR